MNCQTLQSGPKEKFCCSGDHHTLSLSFSFITHTYIHTHTHTPLCCPCTVVCVCVCVWGCVAVWVCHVCVFLVCVYSTCVCVCVCVCMHMSVSNPVKSTISSSSQCFTHASKDAAWSSVLIRMCGLCVGGGEVIQAETDLTFCCSVCGRDDLFLHCFPIKTGLLGRRNYCIITSRTQQ